MEIPQFPELTFEDATHTYKLNGVVIPNVTTLMSPLTEKTYDEVDPVIMMKAAARGTAVHEACENYALYGIEDCPAEYKGYFDAFKLWWDEKKPVVLSCESHVYHKMLGYAGTSDLLCEIKGHVTLVDYKTTAKVEAMLCGVQLEGYARAWESHGIKIEDRMILQLSQTGKFLEHHYLKDKERWEVLNALLKIRNYVNKF